MHRPVQTALAITLFFAFLGIVISVVRYCFRFRGYLRLASTAREIASALKAEITHDGPDLLICGAYQAVPTFVRFSNTEGAPRITVNMRAQASFELEILPANFRVADPLRSQILSGDSSFDQRFILQTDQPGHARQLLTRSAFAHIQKLCCSPQTLLKLSPIEIEVKEMVIPVPETGNHMLLHIQSLRSLADYLQAVKPETDSVREIKRERHLVRHSILAVGLIIAIAAAVNTIKQHRTMPIIETPAIAPASPTVAAGIPPNDAKLIRMVADWRMAKFKDLPQEGAGWLRSNGIDPSHINGDFAGNGQDAGSAYLLINDKHVYRVVVIANHSIRYDMEFNALAGIGRIPKESAGDINWNGQPPPEIKGDGLLIVTNAQDRGSSLAIFFPEDGLSSAVPADYQNVPMR